MRVQLSAAAEADLKTIGDWLFERNPLAARRLTERFRRMFRLMEANPRLGRPCPEIASDARLLVNRGHLILYRVTPAAIEIVRIIDARRDRDALLDL